MVGYTALKGGKSKSRIFIILFAAIAAITSIVGIVSIVLAVKRKGRLTMGLHRH